MMITEMIKPIKLLSGSHADTGTTGQGCFMNVIAYLNGEPQITDKSPCVCVVVKPIAIFLNDFLKDSERELLIPYIERAMGSATSDKIELVRRANLVVKFAKKCALITAECAEYAESAAKYAAESAAEYAKYAAEYAKYAAESAKYAAESAKYAAECAEYAESAAEYAKYAEYRQQIIDATIDFLNQALPQKSINDEIVISRAKEYLKLCEV
jgi:hypothetical protein